MGQLWDRYGADMGQGADIGQIWRHVYGADMGQMWILLYFSRFDESLWSVGMAQSLFQV